MVQSALTTNENPVAYKHHPLFSATVATTHAYMLQ